MRFLLLLCCADGGIPNSLVCRFERKSRKMLFRPIWTLKNAKKETFGRMCAFESLVLVKLLFWRESSRIAFPGAEKVFACINCNCKDSELFFWEKKESWLFFQEPLDLQLVPCKVTQKKRCITSADAQTKLFSVLLATLSHCNRFQELVIA